jgi:uncharacterized protein YhfF
VWHHEPPTAAVGRATHGQAPARLASHLSAAAGEGGEPPPAPGRRDVALDSDGNPAVVLETLTTQCIRFCDVAEDLALAEGENDDLDGWRRDHRTWFERSGGWHPEMWLLFETFRMVEDRA